jgi:hypothetical protein
MDAFVLGIDDNVKQHLDELSTLLGKRVFRAAFPSEGKDDAKSRSGMTVPQVLSKDLAPKRVSRNAHRWASDSIARILSETAEEPLRITLAEHIDTTPELVELKYAFQKYRRSAWPKLEYNVRAVLEDSPNIEDYLIAFAFHAMRVTDVNALCSFVLHNSRGAKRVVQYCVVSASRTLIDEQQLNVEGYNDDDGDLATALRTSNIALSAAAFSTDAMATIKRFLFDSEEKELLDLINGSKFKSISEKIKPTLIKYIQNQNSRYKITAANIDYHIPVWLTDIYATQGYMSPEQPEPILDDQDFIVQFQDDPKSSVSDISRPAVRCAALLYHGMVLGDELDVFGAVNYFTHKYLVRGGIEIRDKRLRLDLRDYVFSERFMDLKTNRITDRTRPAERQMFYRQVFNEGNAEVTEDVMLNSEFKRLWKVLMLESAKYLQRAQTSFNPDNFVSRQNVMQSVEDLQYNLSLSCTGMVNVIAPLIDAELNFVLTRIFKHPEVVSQVVPSGGGWQRVVETLSAARKHSRGRATTLYNKARLGEAIIRSVAEYTPADFETDAMFSKFISQVDAYITTQSILQEALTDDLLDGDEDDADSAGGEDEDTDHMEQPIAEDAPREKTTAAAGGNEWDF